MSNMDKLETDLDVFFTAAKEPSPTLSMDLMSRILGDAADVAANRVEETPATFKRESWFKRWLEPLGGIQGVATVGFCAFLGLAIGYTGTDTLESVPGVGPMFASISDDPLDDLGFSGIGNFDDFLAEG